MRRIPPLSYNAGNIPAALDAFSSAALKLGIKQVCKPKV